MNILWEMSVRFFFCMAILMVATILRCLAADEAPYQYSGFKFATAATLVGLFGVIIFS